MPTPSEQFLTAATTGNLAIINAQFANTPDLLNVKDGKGRTAWWFAYANNHKAVANELQRLGIEVPSTYLDFQRLQQETIVTHHPNYQERVFTPEDRPLINEIKALLTTSIHQRGIDGVYHDVYLKLKALKHSPDIVRLGQICMSFASDYDYKRQRCHLQIAILLQDQSLLDLCITKLGEKKHDFNADKLCDFELPIYYALEQYNQPLVYSLLRQKSFPDNYNVFIQHIEPQYIDFFLLTITYTIFATPISSLSTPLIHKVINNQFDRLIPYLANANLLDTDYRHCSAFKYAYKLNKIDLAFQILTHIPEPDQKLRREIKEVAQDLFFEAAIKGNLAHLNLALEHGCSPDINIKNKEGHTAWFLAISHRHEVYACHLHQLGAVIPEDYLLLNDTAQQLALVEHPKAIKKSIINLSRPEKALQDDVIALILASNNLSQLLVSSNNIATLLSRSSDSNLQILAKDFQDYLIIHEVTQFNNYPLPVVNDNLLAASYQTMNRTITWHKVRIMSNLVDAPLLKEYLPRILSNYAQFHSINLKDKSGLTLLSYAIKDLNLPKIALFLQLQANISELASHFETWSKDIPEHIKFFLLIAVYANLKTPFDNQESLVHIAVRHNILALIPLCKTAGLSLNSENKSKQTPLDLAIEKGIAGGSIAAKLLIYGAEVSIAQQTKLLAINVNIASCLFERVKLIEEVNKRLVVSKAVLSGQVATLTEVLVETRETNEHLLEKITVLETKSETHRQQQENSVVIAAEQTAKIVALEEKVSEQQIQTTLSKQGQEKLEEQITIQAEKFNTLNRLMEQIFLKMDKPANMLNTSSSSTTSSTSFFRNG